MTSATMKQLLALVALGLAQNGLAYHIRGLDSARVITRADDIQQVYDYVVIGGGTSGLTVADRLTEDGKTTVLVIEYGQLSDSASISTVRGGFQGMTNAQLMYSITSVQQTNLRNRTTAVLAGKVVGGSSAVNAMMTIRGTAEDYNRWGSFFSNHSEWSFEGLLPYFKRALTFVPPNEDVAKSSNIVYDTSFWGNTSRVYASWPSYQYPTTRALVEGFKGIPGVEFPADSGEGKPGVYWYPQFMDPKPVTRSYARTGHYDGLNRPNYHLLPGYKVTGIKFNGTTATGVSFIRAPGSTSGSAQTSLTSVQARKEVILAAGAVHSPQILQLSGIGPKALLTSANISTLVDLPGVGQNFQDHPMLQAMFTLRNITDPARNASFQSWSNTVWAANKTGPNSIATGNAAAWLPFPVISTRSAEVAASLDAQNHAGTLPAGTDSTVAAGYSAQMKSYAAALRANGTAFYNLVITGGAASGAALVALHPLSRGTVNIDLRDPQGREPLVDYRALSNPIDTTIMTDILRFTRRYHMNNPATAHLSPAESMPGTRVSTDAQFADYLAQSLSPTEYHPAGTCAMLPRELGGVVDEELKVYGVKGLRVIDASMMPTLPGANTCQTVYAVAEKAADLIRYGPKKTE